MLPKWPNDASSHNAVEGGTGKAEAAKLQDAGISLKQSYIRECQEKYLPLGSVPTDFSLGIQPD